jgi:hypothetical protein
MDGIGEDGLLRHSVPTHIAMRVFLIACGTSVLILSAWELHSGVWPFNIFSLFFGAILVGAFSVGIPMILFGLLGPTLDWTVAPGRIEIVLTNPFRRWVRRITPGAVAEFTIRESDGDGGPSTWYVVLKTVENKRYESRQYGSRAAAENLLADIERIFYAEST